MAFTKTGERLVGEPAKRQAVTNSDRTISSIKRHMGSDYKVTIDGKSYTPQEISAMILQKLKADAEAYLGEKVTEAVIEVTVKDYTKKPPKEKESIRDKFTFAIRKCAHFSLYLCLGALVSLTAGRRKVLSIGSAGTMIFCFLYAVSDEIHQHFVPGRSCEFRDVMIDTSGALTGMLLSMFGMDAVIIRKLYWIELALFYGVFLIRKCQILSTFCNPFTTFLYLCALELLPTGLLAASAVFL